MISTRKRRRRVIALVAFAIVYTLALVFTGCSDIILQPPGGQIDAGPATRRLVPANGRDVEVWVARPSGMREEPHAFVLEFTGNATRAEQIAQFVADRWRKHPIEAWTVNYPGYGGSPGPLHMSLIPQAALACYD